MSEIYAFGDSVLKGIVLENEKYKVCKNIFSNICEDVLNVVIENKAKFGSTISIGEKSFQRNIICLTLTLTHSVILWQVCYTLMELIVFQSRKDWDTHKSAQPQIYMLTS